MGVPGWKRDERTDDCLLLGRRALAGERREAPVQCGSAFAIQREDVFATERRGNLAGLGDFEFLEAGDGKIGGGLNPI